MNIRFENSIQLEFNPYKEIKSNIETWSIDRLYN